MSDEFFFIKNEPPKQSATSKPVELTPDVGANPAGDEWFFVPQNQQPSSNDTNDFAKYVGAGTGAAYKVMQTGKDAQAPITYDPNMPMNKRGLESYVASQISPKYELPIKELEKITGLPVRTMKEAQAAINFIQGEKAKRTAKPHTDVSGLTRYTYTSEPGRQPYDLSAYERGLLQRLKSTASPSVPYMKSAGQGAVAGAIMLPQALDIGNDILKKQTIEKEKLMSLIGSGLMMSRSPLAILSGMGLQAPYAVKHGEEILQNMGLGEINPTAFGGSPEALQSPLNMGIKPSTGLP